MEKIKNVLGGHKKNEDATHETPATSSTGAQAGTHGSAPTSTQSGTHTESQTHPIYDEMTAQTGDPTTTTSHPTTATSTTTPAATGAASGLGKGEPGIAQGSSGTHSTTSDSVRPGTSTLTSGNANDGFSQASIKSGVIGFGGMGQEHAAMPSRNNPAEKTLDHNQVVGGGNTTADTPNQPSVASQNAPHSSATSRDQATTSTGFNNAPGSSTTQSTATQQPFEKDFRQDSYTADTNRTFPLAGGVSSKHTTGHPTTSAREPGTKEKEVGVHDGQGREGLAAAAGLAAVAGVAAPIYREEHKNDPSINQSTVGSTTNQSTQGHNPEALAAARAAAAHSSSQDQGNTLGGTSHTGMLGDGRPGNHRTASHPHIPGEFPSPTPDESKTFLYYRDNVVPEPVSNTGVAHGHPAAQDQAVAPVAGGLATTTAGPHSSDAVNKADPRVDSDRDGSRTVGTANSGSHELRHTGTLDEPKARSTDVSEDHTGRNAAIAGGIGAGAAGLGYAASRKHDAPSAGHDTQPSPYSSTALDPRVMGNTSTVDTPTQHVASAPNAAGVPSAGTVGHGNLTSNQQSGVGQDPSVQKSGSEHHYGRDAALVGAGAATGAGVHHSLKRNDTPGTGTSALPQDSSKASAPLSSSTTSAPQPTSQAQPASANPDTYKGPLTTSGKPFYGTAGAPGPVPADTSAQTHQSGPTTSPTSSGSKDEDAKGHHGKDAALAGAGAAGVGGLAYAAHRDNKTDTGPASNTIGPHSSNAANIVDPRVQPDPSKQIHHNVGPTAEDPATKTIGPHDSNIANILDPRVKPDPAKQKGHTTTGPHQSDTLNRLDPKVDEKADQKNQHHYGRDAAVVGGAGAAGYSAYEAAKAYGDHRSTQPGASMADQRYDPTLSGAHAPNPVPASGHYDYNDPATSHNVNHLQSTSDAHSKDNTHRNAALGGAALGAGALGGAAYANSRQPDSSHQPLGTSAQQAPLSQSHPVSGSAGQQAYDSTTTPHTAQSNLPGATHNRYDSTQDPQDVDHTKRNAALGTAGVATAAGGAYAYSQHQDADRERARLEKENQERLKKEQHKLDKEQHKHDKAVAAHDKEQHKLEKDQAKHQKEEEKEAHRLEKERQKEAERLEKEREKEAEPEKKHGILGFLHRDKTKKEKRTSGESSPRQSGEIRRSHDSNPRHSKEYAAGGAALGAGAAAASTSSDHEESPRWKGKNRLHKDPPKGHPAREALAHQNDIELQEGGKREHVGVDGPIGQRDAISGYQQEHGKYGAQPLSEVPQNKRIIEPHTGLPMNVGRFGEGVGGTDANPAIAGHHHASGGQTGASNLDTIKKNDTLY